MIIEMKKELPIGIQKMAKVLGLMQNQWTPEYEDSKGNTIYVFHYDFNVHPKLQGRTSHFAFHLEASLDDFVYLRDVFSMADGLSLAARNCKAISTKWNDKLSYVKSGVYVCESVFKDRKLRHDV
jgi:hypothetical protein